MGGINNRVQIIYQILYQQIMSVKVAVRVRPFNQRQKFLGCICCIKMKDKTTMLINPRDRNQKQHQFTFDYSFWSHDGFEELENGYLYPIDDRFIDQKRIFKELGEDIITNAWNGFNCCLFAYGQTGAGKSYSMIGYEANRGIVPMACQKIFQGIAKTQIKGKKEYQVTISMLQIYNEKVQDLFMHTSKRPPNGLKIRQNKKYGVYVEGITKYEVKSYHQIQRKMQEGAKHRSLAATLMNEYSSRAHTIVIIEFIQKQFITEQKMNKKSSTLNLVDLAGSERIAKTGINNKDRLKEASQINKSLHTLGRVIEHLAEQAAVGKTKTIAIPYRDSALTRILQTALGGNSVTTMICAISPANDNYEQTLSTLRYADQAKKIRNKPIINESAVDKIIRELRQENERLKQMLRIAKLKGLNLEDTTNLEANMLQIQREIRKTMHSFAINTDDMQQEQDLSNIMMTQFVELPDPSEFNPYEILQVSSFDSSLGSKNFRVYLTNLSEDPMLSYKIKYSCENELYVGNKNLKEGGTNKLVLCGLGIEDRHARVYEINQRFYIQPLSEQAAEYTIVNGRPIEKAQQLYHNDRVIFGTNSVFLFKNNNNIEMRKNSSLKIIPTHAVPSNKTRSSFGIGTESMSSKPKYKSEPINIRASFGNQSLLLEDLDDFDIVPKNSLPKEEEYSTGNEMGIGTQNSNIHTISEKDLDYEFAINQRQSKLQTSTSFSSSNAQIQINNDQMAKKLEDIQKEFQILLKENEMKMKEKEQQFQRELKRVEKEKELQKKKLIEELRNKEKQAMMISKEKQKLEKARQKLIELEYQKRMREKAVRQSMLLEGYDDMQEESPKTDTKIEYVDRHHHHFHYEYNQLPQNIIIPENYEQVPHPHQNAATTRTLEQAYHNSSSKQQQNTSTTNNYTINNDRNITQNFNRSNSQLSTQQTENVQQSIRVNKSNLFAPKQAINIKIDPIKEAPKINSSENETVSTTQMPSFHDETLLLQSPPQDILTNHSEQLRYNNAESNTQLDKETEKFQKNSTSAQINTQLDPEEARLRFIDQVSKNQEQNSMQKSQSKIKNGSNKKNLGFNQQVSEQFNKSSPNQLNISEILQSPTPSPIESDQYQEEQSNLLNASNNFPLQCYISGKKIEQPEIQPPFSIQNPKPVRQSYFDVSLNLSEDEMSITQHLKEEELNDKIRELEEKLKLLSEKENEKQENIKSIRKSFIEGFGQNPSSENFFVQGTNFDEDFQISMIETRKNSDNDIEKLQLEKKLKMKMVQCQNQNILNERSIQVRKRKREADEIRELYIKKQKRQIQKHLIELIPMLQKFNLWAREMSRNLQGKISIEYRNFTNYEILEALKSHTFKSNINIFIKILNYEEGRVYNWSIPVFQNRYEILENLFEKFLENPAADYFTDKYKDPFWEPKDFQPHGVSYLSLQPLCYALTFEGEISFAFKGQVIATMQVTISPFDHQSKLKEKFADQVVTQQIHDPRQLLQKDIYFTLTIDKITPTDHLELYKIQKFYISYELIEDGFRSRTYKTQEFSTKKLDIMYAFRHSFRNVTQHTLAYLADSPICFTLNALFQFDDELSNMTSSFINSQSNLNLSNSFSQNNDSGGSKSDLSAVLSVSTSSPNTFKKKTSVVFQNTEILGKIEKDYSTAQRKRQKILKQPSSSSSKKKQKHNDKECTLF